MDSIQLQNLIRQLDKKSTQKEIVLKENLKNLNKYFDPIYHINNILPNKIPLTAKINSLLDETIIDATHVLNNKIDAQASGSFLLKSGSKMVTKAVHKTISSNRNKIKAVGLAIIKNIFS